MRATRLTHSLERFFAGEAKTLRRQDLDACRRVIVRAEDHLTALAVPAAQRAELMQKGLDKAELTDKQRAALSQVMIGRVQGYEVNVTSAEQTRRHHRLEVQCQERGVRYTSRQVHPRGKMHENIALALESDQRMVSGQPVLDRALAGGGVLKLPQAELRAEYRKCLERGQVADVDIKDVSPEVGAGVFARSPLPKGVFIAEYTGMVSYADPYSWRKLARENAYLFEYALENDAPHWASEGVAHIDAKTFGNHARFINHSYTPNCDVGRMLLDDGWHVFIVARRDIAEGEQLTFNYGRGYWQGREEPQKI
jgi:hypothetical protein